MNSITQDMKYRQSLLTYAQKYGVSRAGRKYNKSRSYIYFWRARYDGSLQSLACQSRRPHSHPNQHTPEELKLISDMHRRNPKLGIVELWARMRKRGYTRTIESLWRVMRREGWTAQGEKKKPYKPKPYEQMQYPGQRVQIDVKVVPRRCIADPQLKLYQYTAIDEYSRYRVLGAYEEQSTFSSADFLSKVVKHFARKGVAVECIQTDNGFEFTNRFSSSQRDLETLFEATARQLGIRHKLIRPYTPRHNGKVERSHREDQKRFYDTHRFYSLADFGGQLAAHQSRSRPMRPLRCSQRGSLFLPCPICLTNLHPGPFFALPEGLFSIFCRISRQRAVAPALGRPFRQKVSADSFGTTRSTTISPLTVLALSAFSAA